MRRVFKAVQAEVGPLPIAAHFHDTRGTGLANVSAALDCGINYFDVAPAYGGTVSETVLGKALKGVARVRYHLSTKVGKYVSWSNTRIVCRVPRKAKFAKLKVKVTTVGGASSSRSFTVKR